MVNEQLLNQVTDIARQAGSAIMEIYQQDFSVYEKDDASPLTDADLAAHNIICTQLKGISDLPILSEEAADISWEQRQQWQQYWLVDPLDGTKEFVKKNGEFTVNIALIHQGEPVLGVVYAPALDVTYTGAKGIGAFKSEPDSPAQAIQAQAWQDGLCKVVGSRSHQSPDIKAFLASIPGETELVAMGSSLKLCLVAEGAAHLYPRLGPTSEWDTAAAQAVAEAAGAQVTILQAGQGYQERNAVLRYNQKESLLNPFFLVGC